MDDEIRRYLNTVLVLLAIGVGFLGWNAATAGRGGFSFQSIVGSVLIGTVAAGLASTIADPEAPY